MSKKTQSTMDAFLGIKSDKPKMKQTKLNFGGNLPNKSDQEELSKKTSNTTASSAATTVTPEVTAKKKNQEEKENVVLTDTDDEEEEQQLASSRTKRRIVSDKKQKATHARAQLKRRKLQQKETKPPKEEEEEEPMQVEEPVEEKEEEPMKTEEPIEAEDDANDDDNNEEDPDHDDEEFEHEEDSDSDEQLQDDSDKEEEEEEEKPKAKTGTEKKKRTVAQALNQAPAQKSKKQSTKKPATEKSNEELLEELQSNDGKQLGYGTLCEAFEKIEAITGRLDIQQILTDLFRCIILQDPKDLYHLIYLASNSVAPAYECIELGIGDAILIKAIGQAYGTNPAMIKQKYEAEGDLGTVAKVSKGKQRTLGFGAKPKPLLAKEVLEAFRQIAKTSGSQSQKYKVDKIKGLLVRAQGSEAKYIIRGLQGKLRIGLAQSTVLISLAHALTLTPPDGIKETQEDCDDYPEEAKLYANSKTPSDKRLEAAVAIVKKAYSEVPSYDSLLDAALSVPLQEMHRVCTLTPGVPVSPMLAKPTKSIQEVLKRLNGQRFTCEFKYDGERAQVHMLADGTTKVFSRNLLDTTVKFPEVPEYVKEAAGAKVESFVLDTEVVAFNRETGQFVPFQVLSTRKKTEESAETANVQVIVQAFDLMYLNGTSLLNSTLSERRELLHKHFGPVKGKFRFATSLDHTEDGDTAVLEEFLDTAVKGQCEGLMVKTLDANAAYEPSRRSLNWLKLKKDYLEGLGDSVDLVPLGAYHGRGKRTGVYGAYLLACFDADTEEFQSVCKIGTGFSEQDLKELADNLKQHIVSERSSQYNVSDALECDVWFDAVQVWEVKAADLSKSSTHRGAVGRTGESDRGIGLRFPRFERVRPDKKPEQATTSDQILEMYYQQDSVVAEEGGANNIEDDGI